MKLWVGLLLSSMAAGSSAWACSDIVIPKGLSSPLRASRAAADDGVDSLTVRGYPRIVVEGAYFALHASPRIVWAATPAQREAQFFTMLQELELIRTQYLQGKGPFYVYGSHQPGQLLVYWKPEVASSLSGLPLQKGRYLRVGNTASAKPYLAQEHEFVPFSEAPLSAEFGAWSEDLDAKRLAVGSLGRSTVFYANLWESAPRAAESLRALPGVDKAYTNGFLCSSPPQHVTWIAPGLYHYRNKEQSVALRVDLTAGTVVEH